MRGIDQEHDPLRFRPPPELAVERAEDAIGIGVDGPLVGRPPDEGRPGGIGVVGDRGSGKTTFLARLAMLDGRDSDIAVVAIERDKELVAGEPALAKALDFSDLSRAAEERHARPFRQAVGRCGHVLVRSDDAAVRASAAALAIAAVKRRRRSPRALSLIVDDADELIPWLLGVVGRTPATLWLAAAWTVSGYDDSLVLLQKFGGIMAFRHSQWHAAAAVVGEINRRGLAP